MLLNAESELGIRLLVGGHADGNSETCDTSVRGTSVNSEACHTTVQDTAVDSEACDTTVPDTSVDRYIRALRPS